MNLSPDGDAFRADPNWEAYKAVSEQKDQLQRLSHIQALVERFPDNCCARCHLGSTYTALGFHSDAEQAYRVAIRLRPDVSNGWCGLGQAHKEQGRKARALRCFRRATRACPSSAASWGNLSALHRSMGQMPEALAACQEGLRHVEDDILHVMQADVLEVCGRKDEAEKAYRRLLWNWPAHLLGLYNFAGFLFREGRTSEALELYERLCEGRPEFLPGLKALRETYEVLGLVMDSERISGHIEFLESSRLRNS